MVMVTQHSFWTALQRLGSVLLVLPFVVLSLLPAGLMPARAIDGGFVIVLCTGDGPVEMMVDLDGTDHPAISKVCDWTAHGAVAVVPDLLALPQATPLSPAPFVQTVAAMGPAHDPHGIMARGPPETF
jgi:hypothetical protein